MSLSSYQKLRLQQLQVPIWELRSNVETVVEESTSKDSKLNSLNIIASDGKQPLVHFWTDDSTKSSTIFIEDLLISLNQKNSAWQQFSGDKVLFEEFLKSLDSNHIAIFISNEYQTVASNNSTQSAVEIYLPITPKDLVQFKKQLWGAVYQSCYH